MARSLLFNFLFYLTTTLYVVLGSPLLFAPRRWAMAALANHARFELWLLKIIAGTKLDVRGREKLPDGPCPSPRNINRRGRPSPSSRCFAIPRI
jgi:1-acyl-sn-glycerol-3-phosphate acyltransferase